VDEGDDKTSITNIYPYIINTTLFKGFSGLALKVIPILKKEEVAKRIFDAIYYKEQEVYIPWYTNILGVGMIIIRSISERLRMKIIKVLMGDGMKSLDCRGTN
jgi:short-subunit dehydrogenase